MCCVTCIAVQTWRLQPLLQTGLGEEPVTSCEAPVYLTTCYMTMTCVAALPTVRLGTCGTLPTKQPVYSCF